MKLVCQIFERIFENQIAFQKFPQTNLNIFFLVCHLEEDFWSQLYKFLAEI